MVGSTPGTVTVGVDQDTWQVTIYCLPQFTTLSVSQQDEGTLTLNFYGPSLQNPVSGCSNTSYGFTCNGWQGNPSYTIPLVPGTLYSKIEMFYDLAYPWYSAIVKCPDGTVVHLDWYDNFNDPSMVGTCPAFYMNSSNKTLAAYH
jgi:hypothetical protein